MTEANAITKKPQKLTNMRRRIRAASCREAACRQTSLKMGKFIQQIIVLDETITFSLLKYHQSAKLNETYSL
ncbi:MAG: hypothetical protein RM368_06820 [Nostoc sp. DedSLP03]|uniref:hypothetical protein n=1 Tax=Nostoc sp. DedSLP03 TaxID=3075400 RepID=UPI002AD342A1|nr:hypothetical protein [Nostoc sp. DedSLP03]MDZ7964675.1 hypothetical protein [Nostoc sp. DedSLP03]